jgi:hypothetical protein
MTVKKVRAQFAPRTVLKTWRGLIEVLPDMNEREVKAALRYEKNGERRKDLLMRLHRRLSTLRTERERTERRSLVGG